MFLFGLGRGVVAAALSVVLGVAGGVSVRDEVRDRQWHLGFLGIAQAHTISTGKGVIVGLIDSGVDAGHPDLVGSVLPGADFDYTQGPNGQTDNEGHGTAMAGIIAAHGRALGIAPDATILPVINGPTTSTTAVNYAIDHGATVLCLAFAGPYYNPGLDDAVARAVAADIVVVAGVGNTPANRVQYPAALRGVVGAAAVDRDGNHAGVSVVSPVADLAAPGVDIMTPRARNVVPEGYGVGSGTSDATAIIAGVAALIRARYPQMSAAEVVHRMTATAIDRGVPGRDDEYGYGIVDPVAALTADVPPLTPSVGPSNPTGSGGGFPIRTVAIAVGAAVVLLTGLVLALRLRRYP